MKNEQARIREALRKFDYADDQLAKTDSTSDKKYLWKLRGDREQALYNLIDAVRLYLKPV